MKKISVLFFAAIFMACFLSACGKDGSAGAKQDDGLQIIATIFPEYDWVRNILGENPGNAQLTLLLDSGVDLHNYQPTAADILKISACDLFIYVGGESDEWVENALKEATNPNMIVINLLEILGDQAKEEELVEGMEGEEGDEDEAHSAEEMEYDEHVWLSLKLAEQFCGTLAEALATPDEANAETYRANCALYQKHLTALDERYENALKQAKLHTVLFGDRFPFRYLVDDYGLDYYAAFAGCSAETEASFETILFLADKTEELGLPAILTIEGTDHRMAETIRNNTKLKDLKILSVNSLQAMTANDVKNGATYLEVMEKNLESFREALGE